MFNKWHISIDRSFRDICEDNFEELPFKGTCISLDDFDQYYGFLFEEDPTDFDINYLVNYCEYVFNLSIFNIGLPIYRPNYNEMSIITQIRNIMDKIGYIEATQDNLTIFVPKSQPAIVVSEKLPPNLSYKVIEYNHHSMKGDLVRKQATLKLLADQLEAKRGELKQLNRSLEDDIFYLVNNLNIRHNNIDSDSTKYKKAVAEMSKEELEEWYDRTYDICLYAFMTLDQADRNAKVKELKAKIECNKE